MPTAISEVAAAAADKDSRDESAAGRPDGPQKAATDGDSFGDSAAPSMGDNVRGDYGCLKCSC